MKAPRPTVAQERWLVLASRFPALQGAVQDAALAGDWRRTTPLTRALLFVLGVVAAGCVWTVVNLLGLPMRGVIAGGALLGAAEWLVRVRRLHASGIEESMWAGGAVMCAVQIIEIIDGSNDTGAFLAAALAFAFAGWRLANPLFTTIAALLVSGAIAIESRTTPAGLACFAAGAAALAAGRLQFARPSTDRMCDGLVLAMPVAGCFWMMWTSRSALLIAALLAVYLSACLVAGWRRRHPPLIAALVCMLLLAVVLYDASGMRLYLWLMLWGGVAIAAAILAEHLLRDSRSGVVARAIDEAQGMGEVLQAVVVTTAASATAAEPAARPATVQGQGGDFGGGGASGRF